MKILSLNCGHDSTATIAENNNILSHVNGEKVNSTKHQYGIDKHTIQIALKIANVKESEIDFILITFTQQMPWIIWDDNYLSIDYFKDHSSEIITDNIYHKSKNSILLNKFFTVNPFIEEILSARDISFRKEWLNNSFCIYETLSPRLNCPNWLSPRSLVEVIKDSANLIDQHSTSNIQFFSEAIANLNGNKIKTYIIDHHTAHHFSNLHAFKPNNAIIISHDGGTGIESGFISLIYGNEFTPILPHLLELGQLYDHVADRLKLGKIGGAGKLMGLSSYGCEDIHQIPKKYYKPSNSQDFRKNFKSPIYENYYSALKMHANKDKSYNKKSKHSLHKNLMPYSSQLIAATTQTYISNTFSSLCCKLYENIKSLNPKEFTLNLTGGFALNCPNNSIIHNQGLYKSVNIEPHCDDSGLTIGAVFFFIKEILKVACKSNLTYLQSISALQGPLPQSRSNKNLESLINLNKKLKITINENWEADAARAISENKIIAFFHTNSEIGPRALGARSILANPSYEMNWSKVNKIKSRETWRPFAPSCLRSKLDMYFTGGPSSSPFMLFNYTANQLCIDKYPAIVHVDNTSRVHTNEVGDILFDFLKELEKLGIDMVLNTSFNGPKTPILNYIEDALEMLINTDIDYLYVSNYRVSKISI